MTAKRDDPLGERFVNACRVEGVRIVGLRSDDAAALQRLHDRCSDFLALVYGDGPGPSAAQDLPCDVPPGYPSMRKLVLGIRRADDLIGVIELLPGFPEPPVW